jgi:hypothetical protein
VVVRGDADGYEGHAEQEYGDGSRPAEAEQEVPPGREG